jgi:hypothetical protein
VLLSSHNSPPVGHTWRVQAAGERSRRACAGDRGVRWAVVAGGGGGGSRQVVAAGGQVLLAGQCDRQHLRRAVFSAGVGYSGRQVWQPAGEAGWYAGNRCSGQQGGRGVQQGG